MANTKNITPSSALNLVHSPSDTPLVKPEDAKAGDKPNAAKTAEDRKIAWSEAALAAHSDSQAAKAVMKSAYASAVAEYFATVEATATDAQHGHDAAEKLEAAKQHVARALADAVLANVFDRSEARSQLGISFGFEVSDKTGKPTSKPMEPGNTIAKRVSSVTIAAEYAMTGVLPDRGGESLPLVGQAEVAELLADYFDGTITVRAASERIEKAIRDARVSVPLEMDADKIIRLAGKIESAASRIAESAELQAAYTALFQIVASIPFPAVDASERSEGYAEAAE